ncbi:MAG: LOG family protein [Clostridia bacterium]|nr:LOG family protein [Clostridia bacterium]
MGAVSRAVYEKGGKVISVRIKGLEDAYAPEIMAEDELLLNVQQRKRRLIERADACLVLPGGFGTLDEIGDVLSMTQLGDIKRPIGLMNVNGFFDGLLQLADTMLQEGFMGEKDRALLIARENTNDLLQALDEA